MNKETPYRDQAERTRKKIVRDKKVNLEEEILPPRSKLHSQKRNKNKWKLKYPLIRILALFFILLPISIFGAYTYINNHSGGSENQVVKSGGYEKISIEKNSDNKEKETSLPVRVEEKDMGAESKMSIEPSPLAKDSVPSQADSKNPPTTVKQESQVANNEAPEAPKEERKEEPIKEPKDKAPEQEIETNEVQSPPVETEAKIVYHTVKQGDNLFRIALNYYSSQQGMEIIRQANNMSGDEVQLGQVLKIPL